MCTRIYTIIIITAMFTACTQAQENQGNSINKEVKVKKNQKSDEEWKKELTSSQYHIAREKGTEAPFSGQYWNFFEEGHYECVACGSILF